MKLNTKKTEGEKQNFYVDNGAYYCNEHDSKNCPRCFRQPTEKPDIISEDFENIMLGEGTIATEKPDHIGDVNKMVTEKPMVLYPDFKHGNPPMQNNSNLGKPMDWEKKKPTKAQKKYWDSLKGVKNEKAPNWRGDKAGKVAVHDWLKANYGIAKKCDNPYCEGKSKNYDWAKKTGKEYEKKRNSFLRLCRSCHRRYDLTPEKREQAIKNLWWMKGEVVPNEKGKNQYTR